MIGQLLSHFAAACTPGGGFLGLPTWYTYLQGQQTPNGGCTPVINSINDIWLIVAAVIEILLRIAAMVAVGYVIYGGFNYLTSQGEADKAAKARTTILNALIGLVIAVMAAVVIGFVAGSIS